MELRFICQHCGRKLEADASWAGMATQCPDCGEDVIVPDAHVGPNVTLGGFRIEEEVGRGGMGIVYRAKQLSMDRPVALKVLSPTLAASEQFVERFFREVKLLASLSHSHIVTAHEAGEDGGNYYLAMSLVEGESLDDRLKREGRLPEADALRIAVQIGEALTYAWDHAKLLHRDIKPANIMLDQTGDVKLADLGISKSLDAGTGITTGGFTVTGAVVGTPFYMSPEQARGEKTLDFRADLYSLGATLFHMVTGTVPFRGGSSVDVLAQLLRDPMPLPETLNPGLSSSCSRLVTRMMAKDRDERHRSWGAFVEDARDVLAAAITVGGAAPHAVSAVDLATVDASTVRHPPSQPRAGEPSVSSSDSAVSVDPPKRYRWRRRLLWAALVVLLLAAVGALRSGKRKSRRRGTPTASEAANGPGQAPVPAPAMGGGGDQAGSGRHEAARKRMFFDLLARSLVTRDFQRAERELKEAAARANRAGLEADLAKVTQLLDTLRALDETCSRGAPTMNEKVRRLQDHPEASRLAPVLKGLWAIGEKRPEVARRYFRDVEGPLGDALLRQAGMRTRGRIGNGGAPGRIQRAWPKRRHAPYGGEKRGKDGTDAK